MRKTAKLFVRVLHLIILGIKQHTLFNLLHIFRVQNVLANRKLFDAEVSFEGIANSITSCLVNRATENLKFNESHVAFDELGNGVCPYATQVRVAEL